MKRLCIIITVLTSLFINGNAQNMKDILKEMPDSIIPLLTHNNILDCIDFLDSDMKAEVSNKMRGKSTMTKLSESYCCIELTCNSKIEFYIIKEGKEPIIKSVHSYKAEKWNESTTFYTTKWKKIKKTDI